MIGGGGNSEGPEEKESGRTYTRNKKMHNLHPKIRN